MKPMTADIGTSIHDMTGQSALLDGLARFAANDLIYAVVLVAAALWVHRQGLRVGLAVVVAVVVALVAGKVLGTVWVEQRPFVADHFTPLISHSADNSFPSDHLLALGAVFGACWVAARWLAAFTALLAVLVACARVWVGVHFPVDVAGGFVVGTVIGLVAWYASAGAAPLLAAVDAQLQRVKVRPILLGQG